MMAFPPPAAHRDFVPETLAEPVRMARERVHRMIDQGKPPTFPKNPQVEVWRGPEYKKLLTKAQYHKCGYCEAKILSGQTGDVDHFAPKGAVQELSAEGRERDNLSNIEGRIFKPISKQGYWWLAYEWSNYVLACGRCNQAWKQALFPVAEDPRELPPQQGTQETPLLLSPFGPDDPSDHLRYDKLGNIRGITDQGTETVRVCGLWRESLRDARSEKAKQTFDLIAELEDAQDQDLGRVMRRIAKLGAARNAFAGMVRAIIKTELDLDWSQIEAASRV